MSKRRIVEIKTIKSMVIRNLFEVIKQYIKETNIIISTDGIKISSIDTSENSFTFVKLFSDKFECFKCEKELTVGINIVVLYKAIKTVNKREIITFYINEDEEENFYVELFDPYIKKKKIYKIPILILDSDKNTNIQELKFDYIINISTSQFQHIIKDINIIDGKIIDIKSVGKKLIISCNDGIAELTTVINELDDENNKDADIVKNSIKFTSSNNKIVQGRFKLSYLLDFIKASHLCENMNILLTNDKPLILEYFIADMGTLKLMLLNYS
jgi:proliferating cell nuclear antigen